MIVPVRCDAEPSHVNMVRSRSAWLGVRCCQPDCAGWVRTYRPVANDLWRSWPVIAFAAALALCAGGIGAWLMVRDATDAGGEEFGRKGASHGEVSSLAGSWTLDLDATARIDAGKLSDDLAAWAEQDGSGLAEVVSILGRGAAQLADSDNRAGSGLRAGFEVISAISRSARFTIGADGAIDGWVESTAGKYSWNGLLMRSGRSFVVQRSAGTGPSGARFIPIDGDRLLFQHPGDAGVQVSFVLRRSSFS